MATEKAERIYVVNNTERLNRNHSNVSLLVSLGGGNNYPSIGKLVSHVNRQVDK